MKLPNQTILIFAALTLLLASLLIFLRKGNESSLKPQAISIHLSEEDQKRIDILKDPAISKDAKLTSLVQLLRTSQLPVAILTAKTFLNEDISEDQRIKIIEALGGINDEQVDQILIEQLDRSHSSSVKRSAIRALTNDLTISDRLRNVLEYFNDHRSDLDLFDEIAFLTAFIRIERNPDQNKLYLQELLNLPARESSEVAEILKSLERVAPRHPQTQDYVRKIIQSEHLKNEDVFTPVSRLANGLNPDSQRLFFDKAQSYRGFRFETSYVESLLSSCITNKWTRLDRWLQEERDLQVTQALLMKLVQMNTRDSKAFYESIMSRTTADLRRLNIEAAKPWPVSDPLNQDPCSRN